jgi:hypothetical protein
LNDWIAGAVFPTKTMVEVLPAIALAERRPHSRRLGQRLIHPDLDGLVSSIGFSPEGSRIIGSTYPTNMIQIWDSKSGEQLVTIETPGEGKGSAEFWKPNRDFSKLYAWVEGRTVIEAVRVNGQDANKMSFPDSAVYVWDTSDGKLIEKIQSSPPNQARSLTMTPRATHLISWENLAGTFVDERPRVQRMMNLESGDWTVLNDNLWVPEVDDAEKRAVSFVTDASGQFATQISIMEFPSFKELRRLELPPGVHNPQNTLITADNNHAIVDFRTYERKGIWNKWKTTVLCIELETGKQVGKYDFPFDNDSALFAKSQMFDGTIVLNTWRANPKHAIALQLPGLVPIWETELGDYLNAASGVVSPDGQWIAILCQSKSTVLETAALGPVDWDLVPQNELKIIGVDGSLLETMVLPVAARSLVISEDGKSAAIGALGSVYMLDLSRPFENEKD